MTDVSTAPSPMLRVQDLGKHYGEVPVFQHINFDAGRGEFVALMGESGVGKSSLLNCLAGLDDWQSGSIHVGGQDLAALDDTARAHWRRRSVGFVFQAFHVLPHLDVAQNVRLPLMLLNELPDVTPLTLAEQHARVQAALTSVGLGELGARLPRELSGGQLQRVAIARALVHRPPLVLADEPTGNLDPGTASAVMDTLVRQVRDTGATLVMVTHAAGAAALADRVLTLRSTGIAP